MAAGIVGWWKDYFEELMNGGNKRQARGKEMNVAVHEVAEISEGEEKRMLGLDDMMVYNVWTI